MTKTMIRLVSIFLLSFLMIAATESASTAGTLVTVTFGGNGFSGWFEYDQSLTYSSQGQFPFAGSGLTHKICYTVTTSPCTAYSLTTCEPYTITTSGGGQETFELTTTAPKSPATYVTIVLPTGTKLSLTSLPLCAAFPATPKTGSTFTLSGGTSFTATITTLSCSQSGAAVSAPAPSPPVTVVYAQPTPAPCPVYVCQPRPACCLSRLFHRGSRRMGCR